jgi:hypothetical protein
MFCNASPIWRFLAALGAEQRPGQARIGTNWLLFDGGLSGARAAVVKHHIFRIAERTQIQSGPKRILSGGKPQRQAAPAEGVSIRTDSTLLSGSGILRLLGSCSLPNILVKSGFCTKRLRLFCRARIGRSVYARQTRRNVAPRWKR